MKGKAVILARLLENTGLNRLKREISHQYLIVFNYHRITPDVHGFASDFDDNIFGPTVSDFKHQMAFLRENAHIISIDDLKDILINGHKPSRPSVLITFDDGYKDNYDLALPVLREYGMPALFFIPTRNLMERRLGWWDEMSYIIKRASSGIISLGEPINREVVIGEDRHKVKLELMGIMKTTPFLYFDKLIDTMAAATGVSRPPLKEQDDELMTLGELREMINLGMKIGSHTHSHNILANIDKDSQYFELTHSKEILEKQLGVSISAISYPVGLRESFNHETKRLAAQAGYEFGFSFYAGFNKLHSLDFYDIRRVSPATNNLEFLSALISFPGIFSSLW